MSSVHRLSAACRPSGFRDQRVGGAKCRAPRQRWRIYSMRATAMPEADNVVSIGAVE